MMTQSDRLLIGLQSIETRLKISLPDDLPKALVDGVVLCHLANHIRPRSVASIHVPSPAVVSDVYSLVIIYSNLLFIMRGFSILNL
jgi:hypothetical protein